MLLCRCQLYILDTNPHSLSAHGWLEDVSKVQKYVMSDEEYNKREGTYRSYQQHMRKVGTTPTLADLQFSDCRIA